VEEAMHSLKSLWMPQYLERGDRIMAGIKRSTLPVLRFGRGTTEPSVAISENGQVRFNNAASAFAGDLTKIVIADFDAKTRAMKLLAVAAPPKGWSEDDCFELRQSQSKDGKVKGGKYISAASVWRLDEVGYDFKASGNQTFVPTIDATKHVLSFVVPKGALQAKPKQTRVKKEKAPVAKAAAASAGASDDIVIE
jgi:hypothetical protein